MAAVLFRAQKRNKNVSLFYICVFRKECRVSAEPTPMAQVLSRAQKRNNNVSLFLYPHISQGVQVVGQADAYGTSSVICIKSILQTTHNKRKAFFLILMESYTTI